MPTVGELWRAVFPAARPIRPDGPAMERPVGWVRVLKSRVPAFDALEADDLAILPQPVLDSLAALAVEPLSVVEAVARAGASAVLVVGDSSSGASRAEEVLDLAARMGMAALLLADADIAALERSAIGYIVTGEAELERRVAGLEAELERAALAGSGPEGLAATIARFLSRPVAIEAADGTPLAVHAPVDAAEDSSRIAQYLQRRGGVALRVPLPVAAGDTRRPARSAGSFVILGAGPPSRLEQVAAARITPLLALELSHQPGSRGATTRTADALPADGPPWVVIVARQLDASQPQAADERERTRLDLRRSEPARRIALRGDASSLELRLVAATTPDDPHGIEISRRISRRLRRPVALSRVFTEPAERAVVEGQARATLEALEALPPAERERLAAGGQELVARSELTPAFLLLAALPALPGGLRQARELLRPLLTGRPKRDAETLATLRALLDHSGLAEAAAALGVHRNTLTYRVARIEQRAGLRLSDPAFRFCLSLAVRLVQDAQTDDRVPRPAGRPEAPPRR